MNAKKFLSVFTAICLLQSLFVPSSFAASAAVPVAAAPSVFENYIFSSAFGQISDEKNYGSAQVVINIRDLHGHAQVQKNIASIIEKLDEKYKIKALYLEGASAKAEFWQFDIFPNVQVKETALDALLLQGRLSGAQYWAALNKNNKTAVFGLENAASHLKNIALLDRMYSKESEYKNLTDKIENEIRWLSNRYLNAQSKSFLQIVEKYNAGKIEGSQFYKEMFDYAKRINSNPERFGNVLPINLNEYYELQTMIDIDNLAGKIDVKKVNSEIKQYLLSLKDSLSYSQYADLSSKTDGFRDIDALSGYINVYGTDINSKSQLKLFLELKKLRAQVNPAALFFQEQTLRETITFCLANSQEENEISFLNAFFPFLKQYLSSSLTAKDEKYFKEKFKLFNETYAKYAALNHLSLLSESFAFLNDYYDTNNKRNEIFFENINKYTPLISGKSSEALHAGDLPAGSLPAAEILSNAKEIIIVVSGGYHTEAVVGMLDLKKISNMTITPNISSNGIEPAKANYKRIISDQGRFFKDALAPAAEPVKQAFEVFAILLDLKAKGHLSDAEYEYSIKTLSERLKETSENKMFLGAQTVVDMIKDMDFNEENLNLIAQNFNVFFGEREVKVNIQGDKAQIIFPNGQSIALEKSENGKIINEQVLEQGVEQDSKIELPSVFNADLFLNTVRAVLSKSFDLSSFTDINNEQTYQTLKNIFAVSVLQYGANLGCDGAIPEIEQNYRGQTIDGIPYELIGKMPVFFQKAALEKQEQAETDLSVLDKAQPQSKPPQVSKFGLFTRSLITFTRVFLIAVLLFSAVKSFSQNVPQDFPASPGAPKMEEVISQKQMSTEWYIRQVANEFMQGNPLPKSFIEAVGVTNAQSGIVNQGVIAYDAAVLLKALALYPRQNRNLVLKMLNAFSRPQIRSNSGFTFDGTKPGKYIYKIIGVDPAVNDGLVKDQYLPGTGENAWVGSALANLLEVYKDDAEIRKKALPLLIDIADGIIALQTQEGFIRMAPKDVVNSYSYLGVDYYNTVSTENNISCFQVIKYVANLKKRAEKQKYETALEKLTNAIFSMYDHNAGYFYTGKDLVSGKVNKQFATDCQTWPILAFSPKIIDNRLGAGTSVKLLMKTLDKSGVKGKVGIIGFDFSDRAQIVSYEWTFGWLLAARAVAKQNPDLSRAEGIRFQKALYSISRYMRESESAKGLYNYADAPGDTGFGWTIVMAKSLASSAWSIFYKLGLNPFDIHYGTFSKPVFPKSVLVGTAVRDTSSIVLIEETKPRKVLLVDKNILYYKGDNWASLVFTQASGRVIEDGDSIKIEYSFISPYNKSSNTSNLPNFLIRVKERGTSKIIFFTNSPEVAEHKKGAILMEKDAKHRQWVAQVPAGLQPMEIDEFAVDYGNQTIYYNMVLNPSNDNDIYFIELTLDGNRPYRHPWEKEFFPFLIFGIGTSFTSFGRTIKRFFGGSKGVVNTHVNIVGVNSMNFNRARELFAGARKTVSEGEVSLPVYVADAQLMSENLSLFQNSGVKIDGESVFFANIDGSLVFAAQNKTVGEITQRLLSGKLKELAGKTLEQEGISFDDISLDALICEFTSPQDQVNKDGTYEYSDNGIARVYVDIENAKPQSCLTLFDQARAIKQADEWTFAGRYIIFLDNVKTIGQFNSYMENIFSKASNGNIIITADLAQNLFNENKLSEVLNEARAKGISILVEDSVATELKKLFDGTYSAQNKTVTDAFDLSGQKQSVTVIDENSPNFDASVKGAKGTVVISESAVEKFVENDRSGFAKYIIDVWTSASSLKNEITAETALETARNFSIAKILKAFPDISSDAVSQWHSTYIANGSRLSGALTSNETFIGRYFDKISSQNLSEAEKDLIKAAFAQGLFEKLLVAAELKENGKDAGFKNKKAEKLLGQMLVVKYLQPQYSSQNEENIIADLNASNKTDYLGKIAAAFSADKRPGTKTAEKAVSMLIAYNSDIETDKNSLKPSITDTKAIMSILSAA